MSEWQPIESAPKDGKAYLFYGTWRGDPYPGKGLPIIVIFRWSTFSADGVSDMQWIGDGFANMEQYHVDFTNWQPLPAPPKVPA